MKSYYYKVAEQRFALHLQDGTDCEALLPSFTPFSDTATSDEPLLFALTLDDRFYPTQRGETVGNFDCGGADFGVYRLPNGDYQYLIAPPGGAYCGLLQAKADFTEAVLALKGTDWERAFATNNSLMLLYAFAAATRDTLLFHASVIENSEKGYLFLGKSGTGKSTHSSLWLKHIPGSELMNDDNPVVAVRQGKAYVYGSPWSGKTPCYRNICAPIGAFVRIRQEKENRIEREQPLQAFASLLPSCSTMKWDDRVYNGICDGIEKLVASVPVYVLGCRPDQEAAEVCYQTVAQ